MQYTRILRAVAKPRYTRTGFDPQALVRATGQIKGDPWARREAWRYEGQFSRWNRFNNALPGLGNATLAFAAYCFAEFLVKDPNTSIQDEHHGHEEEAHGGEHH